MILAFTTFSFSFESCKDEKNPAETIEEIPKEIAVEILQEKIPQRMKMKKTGSSEVNDTITSADEIPVTSLVELTQKIFTDGSFNYLSLDKTTEEMKFIEKLNVNQQPENEKVNRTEIKDNTVYLYNSEGELLKTEKLGEINYKPMLDSLQAYLATQHSTASNAPTQLKRIRVNKALAQAVNSGMKVIGQTENEIILEMDMGIAKSTLPQRAKASYTKKAVMRFSPDMTRMYSQKIFEGGQLTQSVEIGFATDNKPQFSNTLQSFENQMLPSANIKFIKQKRLASKPDGTPFIMNNGEIYTKNIIKYNFNNK